MRQSIGTMAPSSSSTKKSLALVHSTSNCKDDYQSRSSPITKDGIKRMLWYPYNNNKTQQGCGTATNNNMRLRFQPIVQVVDIISKRRYNTSSYPKRLSTRDTTRQKSSLSRQQQYEQYYILWITDSELCIPAIVNYKRLSSSSSSSSSSTPPCGGPSSLPRRIDMKPYMYIIIDDFTTYFDDNDNRFYIQLSSFRIHSYHPRPSSLSLSSPSMIPTISEVFKCPQNFPPVIRVLYLIEEFVYMCKDTDYDDYCRTYWDDFGNKEVGFEGAVAIASTLQNTRLGLSRLDLRGNKFGNAGIKLLTDAFRYVPTLQSIDLSNNNITNTGGKILSDFLKYNTSVRILNVSNNNLRGRGLAALAPGLEFNTTLQELKLVENLITSDGVVRFANALGTNKTLKKLSLTGNVLGDEGIIGFARALQRNSTLEHLDLSYNDFGNAGISFLANVLKYNTGIKNLNLRGNNYNANGTLAFYKAMEYNTTIESVVLVPYHRIDTVFFDDDNNDSVMNEIGNDDDDDDDNYSVDENDSNRRYYNSANSDIIRTMLVDYNRTIHDIDDPRIPPSIADMLRERRRTCFPYPCVPIRKGQRQLMDLYQWLFHNCNTWCIKQ